MYLCNTTLQFEESADGTELRGSCQTHCEPIADGHTLRVLGPRAGIVLSDGSPPFPPGLGLLLAKLWHITVLGEVELSEVPPPLCPGFGGDVRKACLSGSRKTLSVVRRAVLPGVKLSQAPSLLIPGLVGLGHPGGLRVAVPLSVEVAKAFPPSSSSYERRKEMMIRYTPPRKSRIMR